MVLKNKLTKKPIRKIPDKKVGQKFGFSFLRNDNINIMLIGVIFNKSILAIEMVYYYENFQILRKN